MPRAKHPVILLHGIHSRAENFQAATGVLSPHFNCQLPLYEGYARQGLGAVRLILEPLRLFVILGAIFGLVALFGPFGTASKWVILSVGTLLAAIVALAVARR